MSALSRSSSSRPHGTLRCVERCWPSAAQARRSDTPSSRRTCSMQTRRRAGLRPGDARGLDGVFGAPRAAVTRRDGGSIASRSRLMSQQHFVGLDVSVKETAICVVDPQGRVVHRAAVESHPAIISQYLLGLGLTLGRVGLEAGPLSPWLYAGLVEAALPAICVETRHMHAALSARINKTDRNDALGIAQMMRVGLFKPVHVKTPASQQRRLLLTSRKLLQRKVFDIENDLRG